MKPVASVGGSLGVGMRATSHDAPSLSRKRRPTSATRAERRGCPRELSGPQHCFVVSGVVVVVVDGDGDGDG
jgi:hypothetical protein